MQARGPQEETEQGTRKLERRRAIGGMRASEEARARVEAGTGSCGVAEAAGEGRGDRRAECGPREAARRPAMAMLAAQVCCCDALLRPALRDRDDDEASLLRNPAFTPAGYLMRTPFAVANPVNVWARIVPRKMNCD